MFTSKPHHKTKLKLGIHVIYVHSRNTAQKVCLLLLIRHVQGIPPAPSCPAFLGIVGKINHTKNIFSKKNAKNCDGRHD